MLRAQPELLPNAMEELVRHDSPVRASMLRFTVEDVELDGVTIPAGEYILVSNLTANHDAERFDDPDRLDLTRNTDGHLGYGFGVHYCVGASLAGWRGGSPSSACSRASPTSSWRCPRGAAVAADHLPPRPDQRAGAHRMQRPGEHRLPRQPDREDRPMNAKEILVHSLRLLENGDARGWCDLFHPEGVLEFPTPCRAGRPASRAAKPSGRTCACFPST